MENPLLCERCGRALESDDAVSVIEGVCLSCRKTLRGLVQPMRADQLLSGFRMPDEDDEFLGTAKPRFRPREKLSTASAELNQSLSGVTPAEVRREIESKCAADTSQSKTQVPARAPAHPQDSAESKSTVSPGPSIPTFSERPNSIDQTRSFVANAKRIGGKTPTETTSAPASVPLEATPSPVACQPDSNPSAAAPVVAQPQTRASRESAVQTPSIPGRGEQAASPPPAVTGRTTPTSGGGTASNQSTVDRSPNRGRLATGFSPALQPDGRSELRGLPAPGATPPLTPTLKAPGHVRRSADCAQTGGVSNRDPSNPEVTSRKASVDSLGLTPPRTKRPKSKSADMASADALAAMSSAHAAGEKRIGPGSKRKVDQDVVDALESHVPVNINRFAPPAPPFSSDGAPRYRRRRRDLFVGTFVGLLLTVSVAYYAIRMRSPIEKQVTDVSVAAPIPIALTVSPSNAVVKLDGLELGPVNDEGRLAFTLPHGDLEAHYIEVTAAGFHPLKQAVSTFLGAPEAYVSLMRQPYELTIATNPPDSEILIDGELRGTGPMKLMMDPTAEPEIVVRRPGYAEHREKITAPEGGGPLALEYELVPSGQLVSITTDPPNATIRIDGEMRGVSPLKIELDPSYLGRRVEIAASMDGFENSRIQIALPEQGGGDQVSAALALKRMLARVNVYTDPPGGRVVVAGKDFGPSPAEVEFRPEETGKSVLVEASMNGTHFGRQEVTIPAAGEPTLLVVPMSFGAQRVIFLLASPAQSGSDHFALTDQLMQQIHTLTPVQRFSVIAATDDGIETWPGGLDMEAASSEQKIRAYDMIRSVRPAHQRSIESMLQASLAFQPTTVWLFVDGEMDHEDLERFSDSIRDQQLSVNIVRASALDDEGWYADWATAHRGTLSLLGRDTLPTLAVDSESDRD